MPMIASLTDRYGFQFRKSIKDSTQSRRITRLVASAAGWVSVLGR